MKTLSALQVAHYSVYDLWYRTTLLVHKACGHTRQETIDYAKSHGYTHIRWEADGGISRQAIA